MKTEKPTLVLGLETATPNGGVAVASSERCLGSIMRWGGRLHSQRIMSGLRDLLRDLGIELSDLSAIAVSTGPGSFTGVRVGLAAAKAMAYGAGLPLIGVATLEALGFRAAGVDEDGGEASGCIVCPILDARRGEVYWAAFEGAGGGDVARSDTLPGPTGVPHLRRLRPDAMTRASHMPELLAGLEPVERPILVCGEGAIHLREALRGALGSRVRFAPPQRMTPGPEEVAWLGLRRLRAGLVDDPRTLMPVYLREPDVQFPRMLQRKPQPRG